MGGNGELDEEPELLGQALHDMFVDEPNDESDNEQADVYTRDSDEGDDDEESDADGSGMPEQSSIAAARKPRRQPGSSSRDRHECKEVDPENGQPCGADFSRAG